MSHILPYVSINGNDIDASRKIIKAIDDIEIDSFAVRCSNYEGFCRESWWKTLDAILNEAERRGMKVWLFDEARNPSGFANGAMANGPLNLNRQSIMYRIFSVKKTITLDVERYIHPAEKSAVAYAFEKSSKKEKEYDGDELVSLVAFEEDSEEYNPIDLTGFVSNGKLIWTKPNDSDWKVILIYKSLKLGHQFGYINMMEKDAVKILIDEVYEKHYERYKSRFGKTIAGFIFNEPCFGNGNAGADSLLGSEQDLPWSDSLEEAMEERLGSEFRNSLPLLWFDDVSEANKAYLRHVYMDIMTRLVEESYGRQINRWCSEHNVECFGNIVTDDNRHARTGDSLGHFFRALKYDSIAEVSCFDRKLLPSDDIPENSNEEFYHFALGKMSSSLAAITPLMRGNSMARLFGGYGHGCGVMEQKYLFNHFMVRGINRFMPVGFSDLNYPNGLPTDIYADGNNPEYYAFHELGKYVERIAEKISNGKNDAHVAVLYHGDAEWSGECMLDQRVCRALMERQIDFNIIPSDVFADEKYYKTKIGKTLSINSYDYKTLVIPYSQYISQETVNAVTKMAKSGGIVYFVDGLPDGTTDGEKLPKEFKSSKVISLKDLNIKLEKNRTVNLIPDSAKIRAMRYNGKQDLIFLFNEGSAPYEGRVILPYKQASKYNPYKDCYEKLTNFRNGLDIHLEPYESLIIISGRHNNKQALEIKGKREELVFFDESTCKAKDYPIFNNAHRISLAEERPGAYRNFSGYVRYESEIEYRSGNLYLEIGDAKDCVEVSVNRNRLGINLEKPFRYDLTPYLKSGINNLTIDVMTTLKNESEGTDSPCGITGKVYLYSYSGTHRKTAAKKTK